MSYFNQCKRSVLNFADGLADAVRAGRMHASAVEGRIESFLDQPAYYPEWRQVLFNLAMERISGPAAIRSQP